MHQYSDQPHLESQSPPNVQQWTPYTAFYPGSIVWNAGSVWRCDVAHTSGGEGGDPSINLHLWTPIGSSSDSSMYTAPASQSFAPPPYLPPGYSVPKYEVSTGDSKTTSRYEEKNDEKQRSFSVDTESVAQHGADALRAVTLREESWRARDKSEMAKELKGDRTWRVGGVGVWAYSEDADTERLRQEAYKKFNSRHGKDTWVAAAHERTSFYSDTRGIVPLVRWELVERGASLPNDALPIGNEENGEVLYAARAWHEGGLHLGKAGAHLVNAASISYGGAELTLDIYEVLCGPQDPGVLSWITFGHGQRAYVQGWQPVEGGRERDGSALLVAKAEHERGVHPGKCLINDDHACVGYGGGEAWVRPFQVLGYSTSHRR